MFIIHTTNHTQGGRELCYAQLCMDAGLWGHCCLVATIYGPSRGRKKLETLAGAFHGFNLETTQISSNRSLSATSHLAPSKYRRAGNMVEQMEHLLSRTATVKATASSFTSTLCIYLFLSLNHTHAHTHT